MESSKKIFRISEKSQVLFFFDDTYFSRLKKVKVAVKTGFTIYIQQSKHFMKKGKAHKEVGIGAL